MYTTLRIKLNINFKTRRMEGIFKFQVNVLYSGTWSCLFTILKTVRQSTIAFVSLNIGILYVAIYLIVENLFL